MIHTCCMLGEHLGLGSQTKPWEKAQQLLFTSKCSCHHSPVQSWPLPHGNAQQCGEISPVSSSCSYTRQFCLTPVHCTHTESLLSSFHLQDMRFSLQCYKPSNRSTCTFFHILAGTYKKKASQCKAVFHGTSSRLPCSFPQVLAFLPNPPCTKKQRLLTQETRCSHCVMAPLLTYKGLVNSACQFHRKSQAINDQQSPS